MTVDILVLQSTFNLHTIRCFLYLICYLGVAVDDTPQGGNALDADEQFLDYSHILTKAACLHSRVKISLLKEPLGT